MLRFRERVRARTGTAELLAFRLGRERFAFDVRALDEALESPAVGPVPVGGPSILAGLLRHGERSIPVFDTGRVLGVPGAPRAHARRTRPVDGSRFITTARGLYYQGTGPREHVRAAAAPS